MDRTQIQGVDGQWGTERLRHGQWCTERLSNLSLLAVREPLGHGPKVEGEAGA